MEGDFKMEIQIDDDTKTRIAKYGPTKLFGDYRGRQDLMEEELRERFDEVWKKELGLAISQAESSRSDKESLEMDLTRSEREYFDPSQEHRLFTLDNERLKFLAQLRIGDHKNEATLTQLWNIS